MAAACRGMDTNEFFPMDGDYSRVLPVCGGCPVREECLDIATNQELDLYGMFGGLTPKQRKGNHERHR